MNPRWLLSVAFKRKVLVVAAAVIAAAIVFVGYRIQPKFYSSSFQFSFKREAAVNELQALRNYFQDDAPEIAATVQRMRSHETIKQALIEAGALDAGASGEAGSGAAGGVLSRLTIQVDEPSRVITVIYVDRDPALAFRLAQKLERVFREKDAEWQQTPYRERQLALQERVKELSDELANLEEARRNLEPMASVEEQLAVQERFVAEGKAALEEARVLAEARENYLRDRFTESWWEVDHARQEQEALRRILAGEAPPPDLSPPPAWNQRAFALRDAQEKCRELLEELDAWLFRLWAAVPEPPLGSLADLDREIAGRQGSLREITQAIAEAEADASAVHSKLESVNLPQPPTRPSSPSLPRYVLTGFFGFVLMSLGLVYFAERLDTSLRRPEDIEFYAKIEVLGTIPHLSPVEEQENTIAFRHPEGFPGAIEAFRAIKSALGYALTGVRAPVLLVTSAYPEEGKTTLVLNLAHAWAEEGRRTVVVGANVRNPTLQKSLGYPPDRMGLVEYIEGTLPIQQLVLPTKTPNLLLVPSGRAATNSSVLLQRPRFEELVRTLRSESDGVLIDSPPALWLSDAAVIAPHVDATLLVYALAETTKHDFLQAVRFLKRATPKPIFVVANARAGFLRVEGRRYYGRYYYGHH